jgi:N-acyl-D-amino-acid deacylase
MLERLGQGETRERIRADIARDGLNNWGRIPSWDCVQISISPHLPQHAGRTVAISLPNAPRIRSTSCATT